MEFLELKHLGKVLDLFYTEFYAQMKITIVYSMYALHVCVTDRQTHDRHTRVFLSRSLD